MSSSSDERGPVELLAEEFLARCKRGEKPTVKEYCDGHPDLADEIRDVFEAVLMVEDLKPWSDDLSASVGESVKIQGERLEQVGDYRILCEIGRGGMGVVYEADQQALGRRVALKVLLKTIAGDGSAQIRFQREAKAAARMHHTNIVPVFDVGQDGNYLYYAMQLIHGQGLDLVIKDLKRLRAQSVAVPVTNDAPEARSIAGSLVAGEFDKENLAVAGPDESGATAAYEGSAPSSAMLPGLSEISTVTSKRGAYFRSVAQIGVQTAAALSYAHSRGIIHRDVKPGNLILDTTGNVWVTDFGLAKTGDTAMTHTGDILGTLQYMSPERFRGQCDVRADVYALGMTLYEMLTLKAAYASGDRLKLIELIRQTEAASPRSIDARIPRDLETIVMKAIDKDPKRRYQSADEIGEDLQRFVNDEPIRARRQTQLERSVRWARHHPGLALLGGVLTAVLLIATLASLIVAGRMSTLADTARHNEEEAKNALTIVEAQRAKAETAERSARAAEEAAYAELAGQQSDFAGQAAHYTRAIKILAEQPAPSPLPLSPKEGERGRGEGAVSAQLQLLYRRRGDVYLRLQKWAEAVDDYAHVITPETSDADLLLKRARAYEALEKWDAAAADWSRAALGNPQGPRLLAGSARRLAAAGQVRLANAHFEKAQALYEGWLQADPERDAVAEWAAELAEVLLDMQEPENAARWTVLKPAEAKSKLGTTLSILPDHSILASGANPMNNHYRVVATVGADIDLAAVRLDALTHPSLPGNGPGRYPGRDGGAFRGTFELTSWKVAATSPNRKEPIVLEFDNASAHPWTQFPIRRDGHWNIAGGGEGRNGTALWSLSKPVSLVAGTTLTFDMHFEPTPWAENLGHFRLSVCGDRSTVERQEKLFAAKKITDPWVKLAAAYALVGRNDQASRYLSKALKLADSYQARKRIFALAASFNNLVAELLKRQPDEPQLQLAWARICAQRGKQRLAEEQPAQAEAELEKASQIHTRSLAKYREPRWTVLTPAQMKSAGGATLTKLDDNSILASGNNPDKDTYTFVAQTDLPRITVLRLEALAHGSLPRGGPGRVDWGNFALSGIAVTAGPPSGAAKAASLKINQALADYEQPLCPVVAALDRNPAAAWCIDPQVGKNHWAVFEIEPSQQAAFAGGTQLTFTLEFRTRQVKHALGRFRLSVTDEPTALQATGLRQDLRDGEGEVADEYAALAGYYIRLSQWDKAAAEYAKTDWSRPLGDDPSAYSCLFLIRGDSEGYNLFCQGMIQRLAQKGAPYEAYVVARSCAIARKSPVNPARAVQWANQAVASSHNPWDFHVLGLAQYRAGKFDQALQSFTKANVEGWTLRDLNWFGLALVHHRLGHPDEARRCLDKGIQWLEREGPPGPGRPAKLPPQDLLEAQLLRREAEEMLKIKRSP